MEKHTVSASLTDNTKYMNRALPVKKSFDIIERNLIIGGQNSAFYFIDGFTKDETMLKLMDSFLNISADDMPEDATSFSTSCIPYVEVDILGDFDSIFKNLLSGVTCLFIDGYEAGTSTRTDVALCYMSDRVDRELLTTIQNKLEESKSQDLKMSQQSLAESLFQRKWYNPFPKYKFTERPDTACACLMEGKVILLTDTSPSALILPTSIFDMIEEANDYYFPPITGIYLKISRVLISLLTVFMVPLFLLFMQNPAWIPEIFRFVLIEDTVNIPLIFQILILELAIDGLRLAALNTPSMLSTPLSVIAGIVMGEFSVESGWFNSEIMLYMAFVSIANYTQPNFELGYALKFMRLLLLILTAIFNLPGFLTGCLIVVLCITFNKTLSGRSYLNVKLN